MGIIPLFDWGEANALFFMEKFTLINKARSTIKVFKPFEDSSKNSSLISVILISYDCVLSDQVSQLCKALELNLSWKRETNIKNFYKKGEKKTNRFNIFFKNGEQVLYLKFDIIKN